MKIRALVAFLSLFAFSLPSLAASPENSSKTQTSVPLPKTAKINLNTATVETLTGSFKGIGAKRAVAIVEYRKTQKFEDLEQLAEVKGIGKAFVERNMEKLKEIFTVN